MIATTIAGPGPSKAAPPIGRAILARRTRAASDANSPSLERAFAIPGCHLELHAGARRLLHYLASGLLLSVEIESILRASLLPLPLLWPLATLPLDPFLRPKVATIARQMTSNDRTAWGDKAP